MRCKLCTEKAIYAELRFCKKHFLAFFEKKVRTYLEKERIRHSRILIGVSGGKDSAATACVMNELKEEFNLELVLFSIHLRIPNYSQPGLEASQKLAEKLGLKLIVWDLEDYEKQIPDFATTKDGKPAKPCSQCGTIKRYLLNKAALDNKFDYVATGHNMDDEHYFIMHSLEAGNVKQLLRNEKSLPPKKKLAGRIKPLYGITEKESMIYCLLKNLPVHNDECPFSVGNPQLDFKQHNLIGRNKKSAVLKTLRKLKRMAVVEEKDVVELRDCPECGYPTTRTDSCLYCRIMSSKT